jgi:hypothetical protein
VSRGIVVQNKSTLVNFVPHFSFKMFFNFTSRDE